MEVRVRLVPAAVFKTVEPCGTTRLVGSIPMHFRHFPAGRGRSESFVPGSCRAIGTE